MDESEADSLSMHEVAPARLNQSVLVPLNPEMHYASIANWLLDRETRLSWRTAGRILQPAGLTDLLGQSILSYMSIYQSTPEALFEVTGIDHETRSAEIGILTPIHARNQPRTAIAASKFIEEVFNVFAVERILANTVEGSGFQSRSLHRFGFRSIGYLEEAAFVDGQWRTVLFHSLRRSEFDAQATVSLPVSTENESIRAWLLDKCCGNLDEEPDSLDMVEFAVLCDEQGLRTEQWHALRDEIRTYNDMLRIYTEAIEK